MGGHTPGPWESYDGWKVRTQTRPARLVADCGFWSLDYAKTLAMEPENIANANLIAAAPELLAACEAALVGLCDMSTPKMIRQVEEAIAKAKGVQA